MANHDVVCFQFRAAIDNFNEMLSMAEANYPDSLYKVYIINGENVSGVSMNLILTSATTLLWFLVLFRLTHNLGLNDFLLLNDLSHDSKYGT